jgi:threonyl-tRNA synthetase
VHFDNTDMEKAHKQVADMLKPVEVDIMDTKERKSTFKNYTVYIIKVIGINKQFTIYPRFSELIDI